jgi:hypothetical protein
MRWSGHITNRPFRGAIATAAASLAAFAWVCAAMPASPASGARKADPVRTTIDRALAAGKIDAEERARYVESYSAARRTLGRLSGQRRAELGYVLGTLRSFARQRRLTARLRPMFLILDRNREWWAKAGPPGSGARLTFGASRVIFQYFPGNGLQIHPLANFGKLNGYWQGRRNSDLRSLASDLVNLGVKRNGYLAWEYYFEFGGGRPPWVSGMAQGTAMQALARAGDRLADPALTQAGRRGLGAFEQRTPRGVRVPQSNGDWYALYSFAPKLYVLNGHLQAVNGLRTHAELSGDAAVLERFKAGDAAARKRIASFDTGAWSLYSRPSWVTGPEASLNYHTLNRDFARNLCKGTGDPAYCGAADAFTRYLKEDPTLDPQRAVPSPAVGGRGVRFKFRVSKIGRVGLVVRAGGRAYLSTSASFARGHRYIRWVPPRLRTERTYEYTLYARDLAGNSYSTTGELRVKAARRR